VEIIRLKQVCSAKNSKIADEMLQWAHDHRKIKLPRSLVAEKRLFMKVKSRQAQS